MLARSLRPLAALTVCLLALVGPAAAQGLTEARVRAFLTEQERAWNAGRLDAYFAGFTPDAQFVEQARTPREVIDYGRSTLAQARVQARKSQGRARATEQARVRRILIAPDGGGARVLGDKLTTVRTGGKDRRYCAETEQTLVLVGGRLKSTGQVDTQVRCPRARPG